MGRSLALGLIGLFALTGCEVEELADPPSGAAVSLVAAGSDWRYLDDGSDPGEGWQELEFDDSAWATGSALLGFGRGDEATPLRCVPDVLPGAPCPEPQLGIPIEPTLTHFFRHRFEIEDPAAFLRMRLRLMRDDGAVIYLNGREVARSNLRPGHEGQGVAAGSDTKNARTWLEYRIDPSWAVSGTNVMAAEVHLAKDDGEDVTDLGFDLDLIGFDPQRTAVRRGPYLQRVTSDSAVIAWSSGDRMASRLVYGTDPEQLDGEVHQNRPRMRHAVELSGLEPATRYYYRLESDGRSLTTGSEPRSFVTHPEPGADVPVRVWVVGDQGTGDTWALRVKRAFLDFAGDRPADIWLTLGDNAYDDGTDAEFQRALFDTYGPLLASLAMWPSVGNHDLRSVDDEKGPYYTIFDLPTKGEAGGVPSGTESYYSFDFGPVHFIALDTAGGDMRPGREMLTWLEEDLEANERPWVIVYFHHPPYSNGWHRTDDTKKEWRSLVVRENILPILEKAGVDLVLAGHSHSYERSFLLHGHHGTSDTLRPQMVLDGGDGREDGDGAYAKARGGMGTVYVVAGSSGKLADGELGHPAMAVSHLELGSVVIDIDGDRLVSTFVDDDGEILDRFTIRHR